MSKGGRPIIELLLRQFDGEHLIYADKGSDTRMNIKDVKIRNIEIQNNSNNDVLLAPLNYQNLGDFEDRINIITFRKKDSYISIGTDSQWYTLDYFELSLRPLRINISKAQIDFIVDFFFQDTSQKANEDEQRNLLMNTSKFKGNTTVVKKEDVSVDKSKIEKKNTQTYEDYPIYFKLFKINETELLLNFEYAEGSALVNLKLTFNFYNF
jgi:hypothetical protein